MSVRQTSNRITPSINRMLRQSRGIAEQAYRVWLDNTPSKDGNARKNTRLTGNTIHADYPYAQRLDEGWSKQSPDGMSRPTSRFLSETLRRILRK